MSTEQISRLEKIRALLAKAESTNHPEEAKAFSEKAQELMTKWSIDDAMLLHMSGKRAEAGQHFIWLDANEYRAPKVQLLNSIALQNDCQLILFPQQYVMVDNGKGVHVRKRRFKVAILGFDDDRNFVELLYTSLLLQLEQELISPSVLAKAQLECIHGGHHIKWRNTFTNSFAYVIGRRLREAKDRAKQAATTQYGSSMAMVLVGKSSSVELFKKNQYPKLKSSKSTAGQGFGSASSLGDEAGNRADIGRPKIDNKTKGYIA